MGVLLFNYLIWSKCLGPGARRCAILSWSRLTDLTQPFLRFSSLVVSVSDRIKTIVYLKFRFDQSCALYYILIPIATPVSWDGPSILCAEILTRIYSDIQAFLFAVDIVLAYRSLCLYRLNRRLVTINVTFFCVAVASTAAIVGYSFSKFGVVATPRFITGCWATMPSTIYMTTVPRAYYELFRYLQTSKLTRSLGWSIDFRALALLFGRLQAHNLHERSG